MVFWDRNNIHSCRAKPQWRSETLSDPRSFQTNNLVCLCDLYLRVTIISIFFLSAVLIGTIVAMFWSANQYFKTIRITQISFYFKLFVPVDLVLLNRHVLHNEDPYITRRSRVVRTNAYVQSYFLDVDNWTPSFFAVKML